MEKEFWLNLPVKDVKRSREFYKSLGFKFHPRHEGSDDVAGLMIGKTIVMLFPEETFKGLTRHELADNSRGTSALFSFDAETPEEVDEFIGKATRAGVEVFGPPKENGFMYGAGFCDPDGHRWNILYMDKEKMQ